MVLMVLLDMVVVVANVGLIADLLRYQFRYISSEGPVLGVTLVWDLLAIFALILLRRTRSAVLQTVSGLLADLQVTPVDPSAGGGETRWPFDFVVQGDQASWSGRIPVVLGLLA
jgi:hypothetical protein